MSDFLVKNDVLTAYQSFKDNRRLASMTKVLILSLTTGSTLVGCDQEVIQSIEDVGERQHLKATLSRNNNETAGQAKDVVRDAYSINSRNMNFPIGCRNKDITKAYADKKTNVQVKGCGQVEAILASEDGEHRQQRFSVELIDVSPSQRVVVAHDTHFGRPIENLQKNDTVVFYGVYVYTLEGGTIQWTQKKVPSRYQSGWVEKNGVRYD